MDAEAQASAWTPGAAGRVSSWSRPDTAPLLGAAGSVGTGGSVYTRCLGAHPTRAATSGQSAGPQHLNFKRFHLRKRSPLPFCTKVSRGPQMSLPLPPPSTPIALQCWGGHSHRVLWPSLMQELRDEWDILEAQNKGSPFRASPGPSN